MQQRRGQARTTLAHVAGFYDWDWTESENEFNRAIRHDPSYPFSHHWYALLLAALKRPEEAIREAKRALELDPLSLIISKGVGTIYYYARQHDEAIEQYRNALELAPDFVRTRFFLGLAYQAKEMFEEAAVEFQRAIELSGENAVFLGSLGFTFGRAGMKEQALDMLAKLKRRAEESYVPAVNLAMVMTGLDRIDEAFEELERAFAERSSWLVSLNVEPLFDPLRSDPRFQDLVRRMNFPDP